MALSEAVERSVALIEHLPEGGQRTGLLELCTQARHASTQATTTQAQSQALCAQLYQASDDAAQSLGLAL